MRVLPRLSGNMLGPSVIVVDRYRIGGRMRKREIRKLIDCNYNDFENRDLDFQTSINLAHDLIDSLEKLSPEARLEAVGCLDEFCFRCGAIGLQVVNGCSCEVQS